MKPYALSLVSKESREIFERVSRVVFALPEVDFGDMKDNRNRMVLMSCHILARACAKVFQINVCDGAFSPCFCHSWLVTNTKDVIDVYPVGILCRSCRIEPILVDRSIANQIYIPNVPGRNRFDELNPDKLLWGQDEFVERNGFAETWFKRVVDLTVLEMQKVL